jgi:uncharacterized protein YjbJ (UPF0337 family)/ElaB/YqjD/DUF883 family membrane-anchored ribosome-binding protein
MSPNPNAPTPASSAPGSADSPVRDTAAQQAGQVKDTAQSAARDVAGTVKQEAGQVTDEAKTQARNLAASAKQEASSQLSTQKDRLAVQSRGISDDLERISRGERPESDLVNQAVTMLSDRARRVTEHLETKEPMDLLDDVRRFAARRPGTFLAIAAGVGLLAGRLTRGLKDAQDDDSRDFSTSARHLAPAGPAPVGRVPGTVYPDDAPATGPAGPVGTPEVLGTPAATNPYGTGITTPGGRV